VAGSDATTAVQRARNLAADGVAASLDLVGELVRDPAEADRVTAGYLLALGPRPVEHLLGVRPDVLAELVARGVPVRVYVPFGGDWFRYWMRRVAESRGA
jgi:proline dehydrogenase